MFTEHPNNPRNIHFHHELQSKLALRTPSTPLVRPPHQPLRDHFTGSERLPDARAARVHACAREASCPD